MFKKKNKFKNLYLAREAHQALSSDFTFQIEILQTSSSEPNSYPFTAERCFSLFCSRDFVQENVETNVKTKVRAKQKSYPRRN
jgi:hypothetical protein